MKKINLLLAGLAFVAGAAFADVPPPPGSVANAKIEDSAASILFDSLSEPVSEVPANYAIHTNCGRTPLDVTTGKTHVAKDGNILVVCMTYYCTGHHAVCNLQEKF